MQATKRLGASGVYVAPVGTKLADSWEQAGWKRIGTTNGFSFDESHEFMPSDLLAHQDRINRMAREYSIPSRWVIGCDSDGSFEVTLPRLNFTGASRIVGPNWWPQSVELPSNKSSSNERSKPVGLTKDHRYTDRDGDWVEVSPIGEYDAIEAVAIIETKLDTAAYVEAADAVPLALNILGYDRPQHGDWVLTSTVVVRGDGHRDELLAAAAANLRAIDLYDQHLVKKRADEAAAAKAAEIAAAKARVEVANREIAERHLRKATEGFSGAVAEAFWDKVTPERAAKLQSALSAYETARRKFEGLPS